MSLEAAARYFEKYKDDTRRLHYSKESVVVPRTVTEDIASDKQKRYKPRHGLWWSVGDSWADWCVGESFGGVRDYLHEFIIDDSKLLCIKTVEELDAFSEKYRTDHYLAELAADWHAISLGFDDFIDWPKVVKDYAGVEISPYLYERRLTVMWYYGWDCASGIIWDMSAMKACNLVAQYNPDTEEYEECHTLSAT